MSSVTDRLRAEKKKAEDAKAQNVKDIKEQESAKLEVKKEKCQFCGRLYPANSLENHEKKCKKNPDNEEAQPKQSLTLDEDDPIFKALVSKVQAFVLADSTDIKKEFDQSISSLKESVDSQNKEISDSKIKPIEERLRSIESENDELKEKLAIIEGARKNRSASQVFTVLMKHCEANQDNPKLATLYKWAVTDASKHWRAVIIDVIDALFDANIL